MLIEGMEDRAEREAAPNGDAIRLSAPTSRQKQQFAKAVEKNYRQIYAYMHCMSRDAVLAEDLTQETFAKAWQNLPRFEWRSSLHTWIRAIALNTFRAHVRKSGVDEHPLDDVKEEALGKSSGIVEKLIEKDLANRAQAAVSELPVMYREVIVMHCYQRMKYREIAEALELPMGTVQARCSVAFAKLRTMLSEVEN